MLKSPLCDLLGIEKPVFQGGMAWIADASLASAVSEAGGLGIIAAMNADANWLRDQIHELRAKTDKPFGVNVMLMSPFVDEVAQVVIDERVPVVVTGAGNPTKYMRTWSDAGIKVIPVVASVALARLVARRGATAVVAEGTESARRRFRPRAGRELPARNWRPGQHRPRVRHQALSLQRDELGHGALPDGGRPQL